MKSPAPPKPSLDHYVIVRPIAYGVTGAVWEGYDRRTELPVAIKVIATGLLGDAEAVRRLMRETEILSSLNHRNTVHCVEVVKTREGLPAIVMEYLSGVPLSAFERRPYPELLPLMIQTLMGAGYLKSKRIVHRDLSMMNVLVVLENQRRLVKIVDFGVAKLLSDVTTRSDLAPGKLACSAPELFLRGSVDWRSDVYSLGVMFHRLVTGGPPIRVEHEESYADWLKAHQRPPSPLALVVPAGLPPLPDELKRVLRKMLEQAPEDRGGGFEELIATLDFVQRETWRKGLEPSADLLATLPETPRALVLALPPPPERVSPVDQAAPTLDLRADAREPAAPAPSRETEPRRLARVLLLAASAILLLAILLGLAFLLTRGRTGSKGATPSGSPPAPSGSAPRRTDGRETSVPGRGFQGHGGLTS